MEPIEIKSLDEFVKNICEVKKHNLDELVSKGFLDKFKHLFRGQPNIDYDLSPSIQRYIASINDNNEFPWSMERNLVEMAKIRFPNIFTNDLQPIELLSLLQHYGIPTRLLDVTENALVALYFACKSDFDKDGEVIVFLPEEFNIANSPLANGIADSYRFLNNGYCNLNIFYKRIIEQPYFWEQKNVHKKKENDNNELLGAEWIKECCKKTFFVNAPFRTLRQQIQCGRYILFPNSIKDLRIKGAVPYFESRIDPLPKEHKCIKKRICIPADKKEQILNDLKMFGISKGILFGDSVDKVCEDIKDSFK